MSDDSKFARRLATVVPLLSVLLIASFGLAAYTFYTSHTNACHARNVSLNLTKTLLLKAQMLTDDDPTISAKKKAGSDAFVAFALMQIKDVSC